MVGLGQGCPLSAVMFVVFMDRISRGRGCQVQWLRILSLPFADDSVLLASLSSDLQFALAARCKETRVKVSL